VTHRVLLIDHAPFFGGSESFLLDLLSELDRQQFAPIIVTDPASPVIERFHASGDPLVTTPLPRLNRTPLFVWHLLRAGAQLARAARAARASLLHTFTARAHLIGAVAARLSGIPLLWRLCDDTLPFRILRWFARAPRRIVAASQWLADQYPHLRIDGLAQDGARAPSLMGAEAARASLGLPPTAPIAAHLGRLVRWKGQGVFIRALAQAKTQAPDLHGLIVGGWNADDAQPGLLGGGEPYERELRGLAAALGIAETTHFLGFQPDPGPIYAAADVIVHSSVLPEPFGRTVIEGMIAGRPVIAARAGALPEIVLHGQTGFLTPPNDPAALATALLQLFRDDALRARLGAAAAAHAEAEYTLARMTRRMEAHYAATVWPR
jgi:glycosyltransferase involved in cell wall biosynthesis